MYAAASLPCAFLGASSSSAVLLLRVRWSLCRPTSRWCVCGGRIGLGSGCHFGARAPPCCRWYCANAASLVGARPHMRQPRQSPWQALGPSRACVWGLWKPRRWLEHRAAGWRVCVIWLMGFVGMSPRAACTWSRPQVACGCLAEVGRH